MGAVGREAVLGPGEMTPLRASGAGQTIVHHGAWSEDPPKPPTGLTILGSFGSSLSGSSQGSRSSSWRHKGSLGSDPPWVSLPPRPAYPGVSTHLPHHLGHLLQQEAQPLQGPQALLLLRRENRESVCLFLKDPGTVSKQTGGRGHVTQWKVHWTEVHS